MSGFKPCGSDVSFDTFEAAIAFCASHPECESIINMDSGEKLSRCRLCGDWYEAEKYSVCPSCQMKLRRLSATAAALSKEIDDIAYMLGVTL